MSKRKDDISPATPIVILELISYNAEDHSKIVDVDPDTLLTNLQPDHVNWINLDGLTDQNIVENLQTHFQLHSLLVEDVLADQRPKAEEYENYLFFTLKMLYRIEGMQIDYETN